MMADSKIFKGFLLLSLIVFSFILLGCQKPDRDTFEEARRGDRGAFSEERLKSMEERLKASGDLPETWASMTIEAKQEFMRSQRPGPRDGGRRNMNPERLFERGIIDKPEDWDDMTQEAQEAYIQENRPQRGPRQRGREE